MQMISVARRRPSYAAARTLSRVIVAAERDPDRPVRQRDLRQRDQHVVAVVAAEQDPVDHPQDDDEQTGDQVAAEAARPRCIRPTPADDERRHRDDQAEQERVRRPARGGRQPDRPDPPGDRMEGARQSSVEADPADAARVSHRSPRAGQDGAERTGHAAPTSSTSPIPTSVPIGGPLAVVVAGLARGPADPADPVRRRPPPHHRRMHRRRSRPRQGSADVTGIAVDDSSVDPGWTLVASGGLAIGCREASAVALAWRVGGGVAVGVGSVGRRQRRRRGVGLAVGLAVGFGVAGSAGGAMPGGDASPGEPSSENDQPSTLPGGGVRVLPPSLAR